MKAVHVRNKTKKRPVYLIDIILNGGSTQATLFSAMNNTPPTLNHTPKQPPPAQANEAAPTYDETT